MKRYDLQRCEVSMVKHINIALQDLEDPSKFKNATVFQGSLISFIYTNNMNDVGKNDKIVRGRVIDIVRKPRIVARQLQPNYKTYDEITDVKLDKDNSDDFDNIYLIMDESKEYESSTNNQYSLSGILDINSLDFVYEPDALVPVEEGEHGIGVIDKNSNETIIKTTDL